MKRFAALGLAAVRGAWAPAPTPANPILVRVETPFGNIDLAIDTVRAFGRVVAGLDVVRRIQQHGPLQEPPRQQYLLTPVPIVKASQVKV